MTKSSDKQSLRSPASKLLHNYGFTNRVYVSLETDIKSELGPPRSPPKMNVPLFSPSSFYPILTRGCPLISRQKLVSSQTHAHKVATLWCNFLVCSRSLQTMHLYAIKAYTILGLKALTFCASEVTFNHFLND